jgi:hypothetical protein
VLRSLAASRHPRPRPGPAPAVTHTRHPGTPTGAALAWGSRPRRGPGRMIYNPQVTAVTVELRRSDGPAYPWDTPQIWHIEARRRDTPRIPSLVADRHQ